MIGQVLRLRGMDSKRWLKKLSLEIRVCVQTLLSHAACLQAILEGMTL